MVPESDRSGFEDTRSFKVFSPGTMISHYKIIEKIGEGGMGVVYKARDTRLDRTVALKFLPPRLLCDAEARERFEHEARAASALNHPNIATIYEIDEAAGRCFIAMEFIDGGSVKGMLKGKDLSVDQVLDLAVQIGEGLDAAHESDVIHRDIKPDNIMLTGKGLAKIMDFGLAKLKGATKVTKTGTTLGTLQYMSPEQAEGREVDRRSDIFSFGVILYEMITGHLPFKGDHEAAIVHSILNDTPEPLARYKAGVPDGLQRVVDRALSKDRSTRFQSAADITAALRGLREGTVVGRPYARKGGWKKRIATLAVVAGLAVIAAYIAISRIVPSQAPETGSVTDKSIAVLPFTNMVPDPENQWFSDGITEDIITQLSKIGELKVISRTSVMLYKDSDKSLREIGSELGVGAILEGSVRRHGDRVRIVSQLVDARTDEHIWAETHDREMKDIFDIQSEVAQEIAVALKAQLSPDEKARISKKPTENLSAYDYYLKGRDYYYRYRRQDNEQAIQLFEKAVALDPDFAAAYAGLSDAYSQRTMKFAFEDTWVDSAIDVGLRALSIDPSCSEAYKALGLAYFTKGWTEKALEMTEKAIELNPNLGTAIANIGWIKFYGGRPDEALPWLKKFAGLNPTMAYAHMGVGRVYLMLCDFDEAEVWTDRALELEPDLSEAHDTRVGVLLMQRRFDDAVAAAESLLALDPDDPGAISIAGTAYLLAGDLARAREYYEKVIAAVPHAAEGAVGIDLAYIYLNSDRREEAQDLLAGALEAAEADLKAGADDMFTPFNIATIYALQGDKEQAYTWLEKSIDAGWLNYTALRINPLFECLHDDDRFKRMMADLKAEVDDMRSRAEQQTR